MSSSQDRSVIGLEEDMPPLQVQLLRARALQYKQARKGTERLR
jgi:hypothetical protein